MISSTLGSSRTENLLSGRGLFRCSEGLYRAAKGLYRAGEGILKKALILTKPHPKFNGVYSRDSLPKKLKHGCYVVNLDEYKNIGTHWIAPYVKDNEIIYFDSLV